MEHESLYVPESPSLKNSEWALEATSDCVVLLDSDFRITYINRRAAEFNGASPEEFVGRSFWEVWPGAVGTNLERLFRDALASGIPAQFFQCHDEPDCPEVWLDIRAYPADQGLAAFFHDVTETKRLEKEEQDDQERLERELIVRERKQRFRIELSDALRGLNDPTEMGKTACRMVAQFLGGCRGSYAFNYPSENFIELHTGWEDRVASVEGVHPVTDIGLDLVEEFRRGSPFVISDTSTHPFTKDLYELSYEPFGIRSLAGVPLVKEGQLVAVLAVHDRVPRMWTDNEVELLSEVAMRSWDAIERTRAERQVLRLTERYRALSDTYASVIFTASADGSLSEIPLIRGLAASVAETGLGSGWLSAIHPDDRSSAFGAWQEAVETGGLYQTEFRILMVDGGYRWHKARAVRILEPDGTTREWIGSCVDVHDRVTRERVFRLLDGFNTLIRDIWSFDDVVSLGQKLLGEALGASRVAYGEYRNSGSSFVGVPNYCLDCEDLNGKFPVSGFSSSLSQTLRAGQTVIISDVAGLPDPDGGYQALLDVGIASLVCVPLRKDGALVAMLGVHQTHPRAWSSDEVEMVRSFADRCWSEAERVKAEQEVLHREHRLRAILEAATVGVIVNDEAGVFTFANPPLLKMLGYTLDEVHRGEVSWGRVQSSAWADQDRLASAQLRAHGACEPYETELVRKDGSRVSVYVGAALLPEEGRAGRSGAAFVTDLTEFKEVDRELRSLNADLESRVGERTAELLHANQEMEGFTYSVSHDLRSPLRSIVATSRILLEEMGGRLEEDERALLEQQANSANKLGVLIDDLLKLSRLSRDDFQKSEFDLSALAVKVCEEFVSKEWSANCSIKIQSGMKAWGDVRHVQLLLLNLIENGCKFSPKGGDLRIGQEGDVFFVSDDGIGFDMSYAHKLFVPFERLVRDTEFPGTGVGLANVQRIVQRHGGRVWAESSPGKGATFYFTLPATV